MELRGTTKEFDILNDKINDCFEELEKEINLCDLSDNTKEHLIAIMNKDLIRSSGYLEKIFINKED